MGKEVKTNAMRMLDRQKIPYELMNYECEEFVDGMDVADKLGQDYEMTFSYIGQERQLLCICNTGAS